MSRALRIGALIYGVTLLLSRLLGVIREGVIGRILGAGGEADVYWVAFILPDFMNYLLAGGAIGLVLIPIIQEALQRGGERAAEESVGVIGGALTLLVLLSTTTLWLTCPLFSEWIAPGFNSEQNAELIALTRIILPAQIFHLAGGLLSAMLQARDQHVGPAIAPLIYTLSVIIGGLTLGPLIGARGFAWGVLAGSCLGPFAVNFYACRRAEISLSLSWPFGHPDLRRWFWRTLPVMLGLSIVVLDELIVKRSGTRFGDGVAAQLHYARALLRVPMGVFGLALGVAAFPTLSRLWAAGDQIEMGQTLCRATGALLLLSCLGQAALWGAGAEAAGFIWGMDRFTVDQLGEIGSFTGGLALGLPAWSLQGLFARAFYAQGLTWPPTLIGSAVCLCALPLYATLGETFGPIGLTYASSAAVSAYTLALLAALRWRLGREALRGLLKSISRALLISLSTYLMVHFTGTLFPSWSTPPSALPHWLWFLVRGGLTTGGGLFGLVVSAWILRAPELTWLSTKLRRVLARKN
ncbi:MAG: lipid II flippase MurJ [Myxococcota bacterium]|nr:lipid II flippase MurJ [Myxococcota bacterium]